MRVSLTNVRGFEGTHHVRLRPITVLIGENSSGKTTLLAGIHAALNPQFPTAENLFNRPPFDLGSFDTIATYRGGKYGRATSFGLGWELGDAAQPKTLSATFRSADGTPRMDSFIAYFMGNEVRGSMAPSGDIEIELVFRNFGLTRHSPSGTGRAPLRAKFKVARQPLQAKSFRLDNLFAYYVDSLRSKSDQGVKITADVGRTLDVLQEMFGPRHLSVPHVTALSPLRTRPRRTYDELNDEFKPEGDHVPLILARLLAARQKEPGPEIAALMKYGQASGLFEKIDVKRLGKQPSDPFQVRIKMKGPDANVVDVGYGVSQALPIVMESITAPDREMLLIQQPEVHLHPKAQAALGTFFAELVASSKKQFVIETHSDYLVDRIRIAVADKLIKPDQVQLLYLERQGLDIKIHQMELDEYGNISNAPAGYRKFFLQEELKLMSRASA